MRLNKYISFLISIGFKFYIKWTLPTYSSFKKIYIYNHCKDQFRLRSNTGMDPGPRSPNNEFVECGKKS